MLMNPTLGLPSVFRQFDELRRGMDGLMAGPHASAAFPPVNLYVNPDEAVVTAELPGVDPGQLEIDCEADTVTIRGERRACEERDGQQWHRRERRAGRFARTLRLPFRVDSESVKARYRDGVLEITAPRPEADKPRKVQIES
jgi:HSP20 family protein